MSHYNRYSPYPPSVPPAGTHQLDVYDADAFAETRIVIISKPVGEGCSMHFNLGRVLDPTSSRHLHVFKTVDLDGRAYRAGARGGDVILSINHVPISDDMSHRAMVNLILRLPSPVRFEVRTPSVSLRQFPAMGANQDGRALHGTLSPLQAENPQLSDAIPTQAIGVALEALSGMASIRASLYRSAVPAMNTSPVPPGSIRQPPATWTEAVNNGEVKSAQETGIVNIDGVIMRRASTRDLPAAVASKAIAVTDELRAVSDGGGEFDMPTFVHQLRPDE